MHLHSRFEKLQPLARALFRAMLSTIFISAGLNHLLRPDFIAERLVHAPMGHIATTVADPKLLTITAGVGLLTGGLALLFGFRTHLSSLLLLALLIPITLTVQVGGLSTMGPFFKNLGLAGGLIYFATHGSHEFSLDAWRLKKASSKRLPVPRSI